MQTLVEQKGIAEAQAESLRQEIASQQIALQAYQKSLSDEEEKREKERRETLAAVEMERQSNTQACLAEVDRVKGQAQAAVEAERTRAQ